MQVITTNGTEELTSGDLLYGVKAIADFLGMGRHQCQHRCDDKTIPTFRMGRNIVARKSTLAKWVERLEDEADDDAPLDAA